MSWSITINPRSSSLRALIFFCTSLYCTNWAAVISYNGVWFDIASSRNVLRARSNASWFFWNDKRGIRAVQWLQYYGGMAASMKRTRRFEIAMIYQQEEIDYLLRYLYDLYTSMNGRMLSGRNWSDYSLMREERKKHDEWTSVMPLQRQFDHTCCRIHLTHIR